MKLILPNWRGQYYDGASNMSGAKPGIVTQNKAKKPRAIFSHCYGNSLQLAVGDMIKEIKNLKDALDSTSKTSKPLKYLPKRETLCETLKGELAHGTPGFQTLCPTRWTVRATSLQSVIDNRKVSQELRNECLETLE